MFEEIMKRLEYSQLADFGDAGVLAAFRARDVELVVQDVFSQPLA